MKRILFAATFLFLVQSVYCQKYRFYPEMEIESLATNEGELELNDGEVIQGDLGLNMVQTSSGLQRITAVKIFKKGEKDLKYKPEEIKEVRIKADWSDESRSDANSGDGLQIQWYSEMKADYYIFRSVLDKKGKYRLLQLLNPGFDDLVQVYVDPKSKDSAFAAMVGKESAKSYYIGKGEGKETLFVKKSKYKKMYSDIFGDCDAWMDAFSEKVKWGDIPEHVVFYEENCE